MTAPAPLTIDIAFDCADWPDQPALAARAKGMILRAWTRLGGAEPAEVAVLFASDERVQELNRTYRGKDRPTNVLSFPAGGAFPGQGPAPLGDIVLAYGVTKTEAKAAASTLEAHAAHLVVHGFLHLLGYDHQDDSQAQDMETQETLIMREAGFDDPYRVDGDV